MNPLDFRWCLGVHNVTSLDPRCSKLNQEPERAGVAAVQLDLRILATVKLPGLGDLFWEG